MSLRAIVRDYGNQISIFAFGAKSRGISFSNQISKYCMNWRTMAKRQNNSVDFSLNSEHREENSIFDKSLLRFIEATSPPQKSKISGEKQNGLELISDLKWLSLKKLMENSVFFFLMIHFFGYCLGVCLIIVTRKDD